MIFEINVNRRRNKTYNVQEAGLPQLSFELRKLDLNAIFKGQ